MLVDPRHLMWHGRDSTQPQLGADETLVNRDGASAWINVEEATEVAD